MLQSWYGRGDPSVGDMVKYEGQVSQEVKRLDRSLATLEIGDGGQGRGDREPAAFEAAVEEQTGDPPVDQATSATTWDVFNSRRRSSVLVFPEQSNGAE
ncbi:hypothetical protein EOA75_32870 [Mesorhizobium sp. M1A.F.Ca.IN.022.07.1.1]|nr:hypothetical protein EOA75_32870 [Mesorhizobium sp. M1A.F.Ca.IN.022.07.1.1]